MNPLDELVRLGLLDSPVTGTGSPAWTPPASQTSTDFIPPEWYPMLSYAVASGMEKGAMMFGPRGSGKSTAIRQLANDTGAQTVTMQCAANMQIDSLIGVWTGESGTLRFVDGPLTIAVRT